MIYMFKFFYFTILLIMISINYSYAEYKLTKLMKKDLSDFSKLYNQYSSMKSKFIQTDTKGNIVEGWFIITKPNKARIEYPKFSLIINNKLVMYEKTLQQRTVLPIGNSPFIYILKKDFDLLSDKIRIIEIIVNNNIYKVKIVDKKNPSIGSITLVIDKNTGYITEWNVMDANGITTNVKLLNPQYIKHKFKSKYFNRRHIKPLKFDMIK